MPSRKAFTELLLTRTHELRLSVLKSSQQKQEKLFTL